MKRSIMIFAVLFSSLSLVAQAQQKPPAQHRVALYANTPDTEKFIEGTLIKKFKLLDLKIQMNPDKKSDALPIYIYYFRAEDRMNLLTTCIEAGKRDVMERSVIIQNWIAESRKKKG